MEPIPLDRDDWLQISRRFQAFFSGLGTLTIEDDRLAFDGAPAVATGLELRRDGTSSSFMPLHGFEARWDRVQFDPDSREVSIESDGVRYVYRIPPALGQQRRS